MLTVFNFTFKQHTKGKGFAFVTFILPVIICGLCIFASIMMASEDDDSSVDKSVVKTVYVDNQTELTYLDFTGFAQMAGEYYSDVEFKFGTELPKKSPKAVLAVLKENDEEYSVNVSVAKKSKIDTDELSDMGDMLAVYVEQLRTIDAVMKSNEGEATEEQVMTALMPVEVSHITEGDKDAGLGAELIQMFGPLIIVFVLYIMIILYGQTIGNIVISEKVSKLMETLLVTVKPVELIAGKIIAIVSIAVLQISMWVIGIVSGIFIGDVVASNMNPGYSNVVFNAVDLIREAGKDLAFSAPVIILSVLALIVGFAFYCIVAGMISSVASKAEELASANAVFQMFVIVSFLLSYMLPLQGIDSEVISIILHAVPFTGAFMIPGSMLLGNVSLLVGIGYLALLIVFTVAVALYSGKLYKNQLFYNNVKGSFLKKLLK